MLGLNRIQKRSSCARALSQNSGMKFRHLFSNDLRDWAGGQEAGRRDARKRSTGVALRWAMAITVGFSCLLVVVTQVPAFELNIEQTKPAGGYALDREYGHESKDVAGDLPKLIGGTKDIACEPIDVLTEPSVIQVANWLVLGGVRTARFVQSCSEKHLAWQITQALEKGEWVMQKVARLP